MTRERDARLKRFPETIFSERADVKYRREAEQWERIKAEFIGSVHTAMMRDPWFHAYAYVKPSIVGQWGELRAVPEADDPPDGFQLITAERIPSGDKATIARWFARFSERLEVFPR